jgi:hypothetical protein
MGGFLCLIKITNELQTSRHLNLSSEYRYLLEIIKNICVFYLSQVVISKFDTNHIYQKQAT